MIIVNEDPTMIDYLVHLIMVDLKVNDDYLDSIVTLDSMHLHWPIVMDYYVDHSTLNDYSMMIDDDDYRIGWSQHPTYYYQYYQMIMLDVALINVVVNDHLHHH